MRTPQRTKRTLGRRAGLAGLLLALGISNGLPASDAVLPGVTVAQVSQQDLVQRVPIAGTVVARELVEVNPDVGAVELLEVLVEVGELIEEGQLLARLAQPRLRASAVQASADVTRARANIERSRSQITAAEASRDEASAAQLRTVELVERGILPQSAKEQSESALAAAEAQLVASRDALTMARADLESASAQRGLAQQDLGRAEVRAPSSGLLVQRPPATGAMASTGAGPLFRIARDAVLEVEAPVFESALAVLAPGDRAELRLAGGPQLEGTVRLAPMVVDPATRLGKVRIGFTAPAGIGTGLSVAGSIQTRPRSALAVPATAVLTDAQGDYVQLLRDGAVQRRNVQAGLHTGELREIVSGLQEGETVLARAGAFFRDGDRVRPLPAASAPAAAPPAGEGK